MHFGLHLLNVGRITGPQFIQAISYQLRHRPQIGALAIETRCLSMHDLFRILSLQSTSHQSFGQVAIELGILSQAEIREL